LRFGPSPRLVVVYWLYTLIALTALALVSLAAYLASPVAGIAVSVAGLAAFIAMTFWAPMLYRTADFRVEDGYAYARYGVLRVRVVRVPCSKVSDIRLKQGPLQRALRLASLEVFTHGSGRPALKYFHLDRDEALRVYNELRREVGRLRTNKQGGAG